MAKKKAAATITEKTSAAKHIKESQNQSLSHRKSNAKTMASGSKRRQTAQLEDDTLRPKARIWVDFGTAKKNEEGRFKYEAKVQVNSSFSAIPSLAAFDFVAFLRNAAGEDIVVVDENSGIQIDADSEDPSKGNIIIDFQIEEGSGITIEELELVVAYLTPKKLAIN
ncbi:MAG: hypothetical protein ACK5E3_02540 [Planctomycetota bacterium]|jgi:hypothetical protein